MAGVGPYVLRDARADDLGALPDIEREAAMLFAPWGLDALFATSTTPLDVLHEGLARGGLIVAARRDVDLPVGFALWQRVDWHAHLDELDVHPEHGRRGLGGALLRETMARARAAGLARLTLATMREVPFNGPWYRRAHGFRELREGELGPGLRTIFERELVGGYPIDARVFLVRDL